MCSETETLAKLSRLTGASGCVGHCVPVRTAWFLNVLCASVLRDVGLCNPMDCSLPGSSVHGVFQARALEWGAVSYSGGSSWPGQGASPCPLCHVSSLPLWSTTTIIVFMILVTSPWCSKYIIKHVERCLLHAEGPKLPRVHQSTLLNSLSLLERPTLEPCPDITEVRPEVRFRRFCHRAPTESQLPRDTLQFGLLGSSLLSKEGAVLREGSGCPASPAGPQARGCYLLQVLCAHPSSGMAFWGETLKLRGRGTGIHGHMLSSTHRRGPHSQKERTLSLRYLWTKLSRQLSEGKWLLPLSSTIWTKSLCLPTFLHLHSPDSQHFINVVFQQKF